MPCIGVEANLWYKIGSFNIIVGFMVKRKFQPWKQWMELLKDGHFRWSLFGGLVALVAAFIANFLASYYVSSIETLSVPDLILDNIPTLNLNFFYVTGITIIILGIVVYPLLFRPELTAFTLKTFASFVIIRSFFISLTHIGVPADFFKYAGPSVNIPILADFYFKNDLFFSAHTGIPFLAFLLFYKENRPLAYSFLGASVVMAITVLFMHVHYSIDVFGAYFITYSIFKVSDGIFNKLNYKFRTIVRVLYEHKRKHREKLMGKLRRFRFFR